MDGRAEWRRLAAFMVADAVGFSKVMEADEAAACAALAAGRVVIDRAIAANGGRIVSTAGDNVIAEFASSLEAVRAALAAQGELARDDCGLSFRIGINFCDVREAGEDVLSDGLNVTARIEKIAAPGGICVTAVVAAAVAGSIDARFVRLGRRRLKNIRRPVELYAWPPAAARTALLRERARTFALLGVPAAVLLVLAAFVVPAETGEPTAIRVAVMPFAADGGSAAERIAAGLGADVAAELARFSYVSVAPPRLAARHDGEADCDRLAAALEAHFVLTGRVRQSGEAVRTTTGLLDLSAGREIPGPGPFDGRIASGAIALQADHAARIAARVGSDRRLFLRVLSRPIDAVPAAELTPLECLALNYRFFEDYDLSVMARGRDCLLHHVAERPDDARLWARLAYAWVMAFQYGDAPPQDLRSRAQTAFRTAIRLDPSVTDAYAARAQLAYVGGEDLSIFRANAHKAIALSPNDTDLLASFGTWMAYAGDWETGLAWIDRAMALNPDHPTCWHFIHQLDSLRRGDLDTSIAAAHKVDLPEDVLIQAPLAAAYALSGDLAAARRILVRIRRIDPDFEDDPLADYRLRRLSSDLMEPIARGLRLAGVAVEATPSGGDD